MPVQELVVSFSISPSETIGRSPNAQPSPLPEHHQLSPDPPDREAHDARSQEAQHGQHEPMLAHPEDESRVVPMPTTADKGIKEAPWMLMVVVSHQNADAPACGAVTNVFTGGHVFFPKHGEEERAGRIHDGYVRKAPVAVVVY